MAEFGYHTIGAGFDNHSNAAIYANAHTYSPAEDGVLDSIFVYCRKASAGTIQVKFALYDVSDDSLVAETVEIDVLYDSGAYHWYEAAVVGEIDVFAAKSYQFAFKQSDSNYIKKDVGDTDRQYDMEAYGDPWPNPGSWTSDGGKPHEYSAYATYTPSGVDETVYPDTFALALTQETPIIAWDSSVLPTTLELALTQESPAVGAFCTVTPDTLALETTLHQPSVVISSAVLPDCFLLAIDIPPPTIAVDITTVPGTFALALAQQVPSVQGENDFSQDDNCVAVWNLDDGELTTDSKGTNTLTNYNVTANTSDYKQGDASGDFQRSAGDRMYIADADLDPGVPLKSGESNKTFSFPIWFKFDVADLTQYLVSKTASGKCSVIIYINDSNRLVLAISANGTTYNSYVHASAMSAGVWYHACVTYDGNGDDSYRIRIWDDTAKAILGVDKTGTASDINIDDAPLTFGWTLILDLGGHLDEVVMLSDVLSVAEIDDIRSGMYCVAEIIPDSFALAATLQTPTLEIFSTITPGSFALAAMLQTPSLWSGIICSPSTLALAAALQASGVTVDFTAVPDPFSLALAQQTPVIFTGDVCIVTIDSALELALAIEAPIILKNTLSWSAGLLTYKGITYEISAGVTQKKFVYWDPNYTTVFRTTDNLQEIFDADGWVMCLNESGMAFPAFARKLIHGGIIQAGTITAAYGQIAALTVGSDELKDLAVSSGKIANSAVEEAKIAASAISEGKLAALSVSTAKIQALAVTAAKIQDLAVTSAKIGDLQVTNAKIENLTVGTSKITDNAVTTTKMDYINGGITLTDSWQDLASVTLTVTGKDVQLAFSVYLSGTGGVNLKLVRGAITVWSRSPVPMGDFSRNIPDIAPSAGSKTYRLQGQRTVLVPVASERGLSAVEYKK